MTIELGDRVEDRITGLSGIVVVKSEYMNGCRRFGVQPEKLAKDGTIPKDEWFDEPSLIVVQKGVHTVIPMGRVEPTPRRYAGGPSRSGDRMR